MTQQDATLREIVDQDLGTISLEMCEGELFLQHTFDPDSGHRCTMPISRAVLWLMLDAIDNPTSTLLPA